MIYSVNETSDLLRKAIRGAGFSWGVAQDVSIAVCSIEKKGLSGIKAILKRLEDTQDYETLSPSLMDKNVWGKSNLNLCVISVLCGLLDFSSRTIENLPLRILNVAQPVLLAYVLEVYGRESKPCFFIEDEFMNRIVLDDRGIIIKGDVSGWFNHERNIVIECSSKKIWGKTLGLKRRITILPADYEALRDLASLTYAPSSERSRLTGAGAGLCDND